MGALAPHEQRVLDERQELAARIDKLFNFTATAVFEALSSAERIDLIDQLRVMREYLAILERRLGRWLNAAVSSAVHTA